MKKVIYISILILIIQLIPLGITYSQPHPIWQRFYTSPYALTTIDISVADSGNFYLINDNGSNNTRIIKINAYGDTLWNKFDIGTPMSAASSGDGGCVITILNFSSPMSIEKVNPSGDYVWYKTYNNYGTPRKIIKSSSNTYLICGDWGGEATIMEIDSGGNEIWRKLYPETLYKIYFSICEANNGGYVAVGNWVEPNYSDCGVIDRIDSAGNLIWEKTYAYDGSGIDFSAIYKCPDGYIIGGEARDSSSNIGGIYVIKIDTSGSKIFSKFISSNSPNIYYGFSDLSTINNNKFIIYGGFGEDTTFWYAKLIIMDFNGNILDSNTIYTNAGLIRGITINNNDFIAVGDYGDSIYTYGYAMRFDTNLHVPPIGIKKIAKNEPVSFQLYQNYPNPFNPTTKIKYEIPSPTLTPSSKGVLSDEGGVHILLKVYDILGREVEILVNEKQNTGKYSVDFNGTNLSSGIYFYSLIVNDKIIESKKMILLK